MKELSCQSTMGMIKSIPELGEIKRYLFFDGSSENQDPKMAAFDSMKLNDFRFIGWSPEGIVKGVRFLVSQVKAGAKLYHVYDEEELKREPEKNDVTFVRLTPEKIDPKKPFVVVVAGGGFTAVSTVVEAYPAAADIVAAGYQAFVITYRVGGYAQFPRPMDDVSAVIRYIYAHAEEFNIETKEYVLNGYSAGGNLVCQFGTKEYGYLKYGLPKPAAIFSIYGFLNIQKAAEYKDSEEEAIVQRMIGKPYTQEDLDRFDFLKHIDSDYPPCYMVHGLKDFLGKLESEKALKEILDKYNVPCVIRVASDAGHGFGDGSGTEAEGWVFEALAFVEEERMKRC